MDCRRFWGQKLGPILHYFLIQNTCGVMNLYESYCLPSTCDKNKNTEKNPGPLDAETSPSPEPSLTGDLFTPAISFSAPVPHRTHPSAPFPPYPMPTERQMCFFLACLPGIQIIGEIAVAIIKISEPFSTGQSQHWGHDRYDDISPPLSSGARVSFPGQTGDLPNSKPHVFNH